MSPQRSYAELDDAALVARHRAGEGDAFGELVRRHGDRLWAVALRTLGEREEAADALQDALLSAFKASAAGGFRGESAVTTWLHRIVVNACLDRVRRRNVRAADPLPADAGGEDSVPEPGDEVARREDALDLEAALGQLPPEQRLAIVLVDVEGYSVKEAAEILDVAEGTVKSRCARGRARLVPVLAPGRRVAGTAAAAVTPGTGASSPASHHGPSESGGGGS